MMAAAALRRSLPFAARVAGALCILVAQAMAVPAGAVELYETGPAEDAAFLRFVNATGKALEVRPEGSGAKLALPPGQPASDFVAVHAGKALRGTVTLGKQSLATETTVQPGEFATVVVLGGPDGSLMQQTLRDSPDDFNAMKVTLVFYSLASQCEQASVQVAGRGIALFEQAATAVAPARRQVNPVPLAVQLACGGRPVGAPVDIGRLQAGGRYTLFAVPGVPVPVLFAVTDVLAP